MWLAIICLLVSTMLFSQSKKELVDELGGLIKSKNHLSEVFFTDFSDVLSINGYQIPIYQVDLGYIESNGAMLGFQCTTNRAKPNCIFNPKADNYFRTFSVPMGDEESVYEAIKLIEQIKNMP